MAVIDDKKNIFTQIGVVTSIKDNPSAPPFNDNSISSVNNSNEIIPFLLDILVVLKGSESLKVLMGQLMTTFLRGIEPELKQELNNLVISYNAGDNLPSNFGTTGVIVDAKQIDPYNKLQTDPTTQSGSLVYSNDPNNFDRKSYDAITTPNTNFTYDNTVIKYDDNTNEFIYKPLNSSQTIGSYLSDYVDNLTIIEEKEFITNILNYIFGTFDFGEGKSLEQLVKEEKINNSINKLIDEKDNVQTINDELLDVQQAAQDRCNGITRVDVGCGFIENTVDLDAIESLIQNTTGSTDPLTVGNQYNDLVENGFDNENDTRPTTNKQTITDGFFKRLINAIVFVLVNKLLYSPQTRALFSISNALRSPTLDGDIGDDTEILNTQRKLADCLSKAVKKAINEFIFNLIKTELLNLIIPVSKIILKEKINQYLAILRSLISIS